MRRPYVILNSAMSVDGKIATVAGDSALSCEEDLKRLHRLRASVDAVMVGAGTIISDDPSLTVRMVSGKNPMRVVVDGRCRIPLEARVLDRSAKTLVAVSRSAPKNKVDALRKMGVEVMVGGDKSVDLKKLLHFLQSKGVKKILLEGGSMLNWEMLKEGLVDEIRIAVAPVVLGGAMAKSLVGGAGFERIAKGTRLKFLGARRVGKNLLLRYRVCGART
ncbi:MAG: 2,5-diamino-6-(ribosylamino)-4(3H)-pyrimidinone 5'-phosphate reductase [Candidatus Hadarchaeales archaeon]